MIQLVLGINGDAVFLQQGNGHTVSGDLVPGKGAVVDQALAAGGAFGFQDREIRVIQLCEIQGCLGPFSIFRGNVLTGGGDHLVAHDLRGIAGGGQTAHLLRAYTDERVVFGERQDAVVFAVVTFITAGAA